MRGLGQKKKYGHWGSISGMLLEMVMEEIGGGGTVVDTMWWWWWCGAFSHASGGGGFRVKRLKLSHWGSVVNPNNFTYLSVVYCRTIWNSSKFF
jgi:hypothetical protein